MRWIIIYYPFQWDNPDKNSSEIVPQTFSVYINKIRERRFYMEAIMTNAQAWDYAIGLIKVDGLEPSPEFQEYIEKEKKGELTTADLKKYLDRKYKVKGN